MSTGRRCGVWRRRTKRTRPCEKTCSRRSRWRSGERCRVFSGRSSLRTYIYRIAHNRAIRHLARQRREPETEEPPLDLRDPARSPEAEASRRQALDQLMQQVRKLPLSLRQPLVLKLEGLTDREIGEALDLREGTVSVRLTRARQALSAAQGRPGSGLEPRHARSEDKRKANR